jgi:hypothetical protein
LCKKYFAASGGEIQGCLGACFLIFSKKNQKTGAQKTYFLPDEPLPGLLPPRQKKPNRRLTYSLTNAASVSSNDYRAVKRTER